MSLVMAALSALIGIAIFIYNRGDAL